MSNKFNIICVAMLFTTQIFAINLIDNKYKNPILPGFHPDPSICRVGKDYYMVNSTFEWFPGVPIYHSKDLVNWEQIGNILERPSQLMLKGDLDHSKGIYAPTIRYHAGLFYMITTAVHSGGNFFVTAKNPRGPWSDPIWIKEANGIDPSLFWDENGDCWYTGAGRLSGANWEDENRIYIAKLDTKTGKFLTPKKELTSGHANNAKWTEGPHIYKIEDHYVLMVAEGGTALNHSITIHTSDKVDGPYTSHQINPVITHRNLGKNHPINTIGHGDLVQTQDGDWWAVTLGKRPNNGYMLARETFLVPVEIQGGIPIFNPGIAQVLEEDRYPNLPFSPVPSTFGRDNFDGTKLKYHYACVRTPLTEWWEVAEGNLKMKFNETSFTDKGNPSFWGRRIQNHEFITSTKLEFKPLKTNEEAGIMIYRTKSGFISLMRKGDEIVLTSVKKGKATITKEKCKLTDLVLRIVAINGNAYAYYGENEDSLNQIGDGLPLSVVGDNDNGGFNGPFVGIATSANGKKSKNIAKFDWFEYEQSPLQGKVETSLVRERKPIVWIYSDISDKNLPGPNKHHTINDPDDISAMAAYLMLYNRFDTRGIVLTSTSRKEHKNSPDQAEWAKEYFGMAYKKDVKGWNKNIGGYSEEEIPFIESAIKVSGERLDPSSDYKNIADYQSIKPLLDLLEKSTEEVNILCWGALTEPAILVKYCMNNGKEKLLKKANFISHWSNSSIRQGSPQYPDNVANCKDDQKACAYLKTMASSGAIRFYECGAIGQHGIVSGGYKGLEYFSDFQSSELGKIFIEGSYVHNGVDFSDSATYLVLLGEWGVGLGDIDPNGTNHIDVESRNEKAFRANSKKLHDVLLNISQQAK